MIELLIGAVFFALLALSLVYRIAVGPTSADRMVAGDACDSLLCCAMILFSMFSGRGIYLDIALIGAALGIIDTMLIGRYLEGRL
ncbi:MAG: cation:proton antiporter [Oscillospiraceae bacterium]|nr:cation:proton antiporter [Oscillospiraceae bacterium]